MSPGLSQAPTITTPAMTQAGMILGTAAYMSPEQVSEDTAMPGEVWHGVFVTSESNTSRGLETHRAIFVRVRPAAWLQ